MARSTWKEVYILGLCVCFTCSQDTLLISTASRRAKHSTASDRNTSANPNYYTLHRGVLQAPGGTSSIPKGLYGFKFAVNQSYENILLDQTFFTFQREESGVRKNGITQLISRWRHLFKKLKRKQRRSVKEVVIKPIEDVDVVVGQDAVLKCEVDNLGINKVSWTKLNTRTILAVNDRITGHNNRLSAYHKNRKLWMLKFRNAQPEDEGFYLCRIETKPPVSEVGHIKVLVPPTFQDKHTGEITVQENSNIVISCKAQGNPNPTVKWHREDCRPFFINSETVTQYVKQELHFEKVHRSHMGAYLCVASNGVPPTISRRTYLKVTFSPTIYVRHNMVTAPLRKDLVTLECRSEAYPPSTNYWLKDNYLLSKLPRKYEEVFARSATKTHMKLLIRHVQKDDYGSYSCVASNKEGEAEGSVDFHEIPEQVESPNHLMEDITSSFNNSWDMFEETSNYATSAQNFHNEDEPHHHWKSSQQPGPTSSVERVQNAGSPGSRSIPLFQLLFSWLYLLQREHVQL